MRRPSLVNFGIAGVSELSTHKECSRKYLQHSFFYSSSVLIGSSGPMRAGACIERAMLRVRAGFTVLRRTL